jgi:hypothetical protein
LAGPLEAVGLAQRLNRQQQGAFVLQLLAELLPQILHLRRRDRAAHPSISLDLGPAGRCRCRGDRQIHRQPGADAAQQRGAFLLRPAVAAVQHKLQGLAALQQRA